MRCPSVVALICCLTAAAASALASPISAQEYPDRTVRIIVPSGPAGAIDMTARVIAAKLTEIWGKPVIVENRPGGTMVIGADAAAKSPPDGYTLLVAHDGTMAINPIIFPNLPYNPQRDFQPVSLIISIPFVVMVNKSVPVESVSELIAFAKANPDKLNHATGGAGGLFTLELFKSMAGIEITSVPFRGGAGQAVSSVIAGDTQICMADFMSALPGVQSDRVRVLAVTTRERSKHLPNVPTVDQSGVPGYEARTWMAAFAPAGTPKEIVDKIEDGIKKALAMPDVRTRFEKVSVDIRSGSSDELRTILDDDTKKWSQLVKEKTIKMPY